jgi:hypothetical protein
MGELLSKSNNGDVPNLAMDPWNVRLREMSSELTDQDFEPTGRQIAAMRTNLKREMDKFGPTGAMGVYDIEEILQDPDRIRAMASSGVRLSYIRSALLEEGLTPPNYGRISDKDFM